jgi:small-conductance mechanosensitive channel
MNSGELRTLRLIAIFSLGIAAFLAATGQWASAGAALGVLLLFSAVVVWRSRRFTNHQAEPKEDEARTRRVIARVLPLLLVFFTAFAIYDALDEDWLGAAFAGACFGAVLVGTQLNRRRLSEIQLQRRA